MLAFLCLLAIVHTRTNIWRVLYGGVVDSNLVDFCYRCPDVPLAVAGLLTAGEAYGTLMPPPCGPQSHQLHPVKPSSPPAV